MSHAFRITGIDWKIDPLDNDLSWSQLVLLKIVGRNGDIAGLINGRETILSKICLMVGLCELSVWGPGKQSD